MAPIRRYLRITKHSVLECRIFLENPADGPRWLLNPRDPALPRVFEAIRPLVLPKLREENERAKGKGKKKKAVKDVVKQGKDDFEVSIFLTEIRTRHSLLIESKHFKDKPLLGQLLGNQLSSTESELPVVIPEESDDEGHGWYQIPSANSEDSDPEPPPKRRRQIAAAEERDEKKVAFQTTYEGFNIWGWVLCLLVERIGDQAKKSADEGNAQALMQEWISSTQELDDDN